MLKSIHDVEILDSSKILGEGAFSEVVKVRSHLDRKFYALKQVGLKDRHTEGVESR